MSDDLISVLESSHRTRVTKISTDGINVDEGSPVTKWRIEWSPKFAPGQWKELTSRREEMWNPELDGFDPEKAKNLILSICPEAVFIGGVTFTNQPEKDT